MPPEALEPKAIAVEPAPLQTVCVVGVTVILGVGFTTIAAVAVLPVQAMLLVKVGVTVTVPVTGAVPPLTVVNELIAPVPLAPNPMLVVLLVHG